jgi:catechol 2,3-dioxygenase-like lactoylglutathione lyase family enzyme
MDFSKQMKGNPMIKGLYEAHLPVSYLSESIEFYKQLGLELAYQNDKLVFFWIEKGRSWLGFWETDKVKTPYHPSLRHIALRVDLEDIIQAKEWLSEKGIAVRTTFGFPPEKQPLVLPNYPHAHVAIYFNDPDGNSIELIAPLKLDGEKDFPMMTLEKWYNQ